MRCLPHPPQPTPPSTNIRKNNNNTKGVDTYSYKQPLGVCAGICPFNFPAMIPLWMAPMAAVCGTYICG